VTPPGSGDLRGFLSIVDRRALFESRSRLCVNEKEKSLHTKERNKPGGSELGSIGGKRSNM